MTLDGCSPISSSLYMTKRARLSDALAKNLTTGGLGSSLSDCGDVPCGSGRHRSVARPRSEDRELRRALMELAVKKMHLSPLDVESDLELSSDNDGFDEGLKHLSRQRCLRGANRFDIDAMASEEKPRSPAIIGRLYDICAMVDLDNETKPSGFMSKRVPIGSEGLEAYVGPLSANEVAHLLLLAQKLQDTNLLDNTLEKNIEMSANAWKQTGKVSNVVSTAVVMGLFESKMIQCTTCGLRFSSNEVRHRHALSHEDSRSELLWPPVDEWVYRPDARSSTRGLQRTPITLQHLSDMLNSVEDTSSHNIKWLRAILLPRNTVVPTTVDIEMDSAEPTSGQARDPDTDATTVKDGPLLLWSWGTMGDCVTVPNLNHHENLGSMGLDCDKMLLVETWQKAALNIARLLDKTPFPLNFADATRKWCAICYDHLDVEFNVQYNSHVYRDAICFKLDRDYIKKAFLDGQISCRTLLSTSGLGDSHDAFVVVRKLAAMTLLKSGLRSRSQSHFVDWSLKRDFAIIEDKDVIPEHRTVCPTKDKLLLYFSKMWLGPFAMSNSGSIVPNSLIYTHKHCMRFVLNAHVRRANELLSGTPPSPYIKQLKVL